MQKQNKNGDTCSVPRPNCERNYTIVLKSLSTGIKLPRTES